MDTHSAVIAESPQRPHGLSYSARVGLILLIAGCIVGYLRFNFISLEINNGTGDYGSYIETAKLFNGAPDAAFAPQRILKPINPLCTALLERAFGSYATAFFLQVYGFYLALLVLSFYFYKDFFDGDLLPAVVCTCLLVFSYPMLRYGLGGFTETGAIFFYCASLYTSYLFMKRPTTALFAATTAINTVGFLWKEYSAVSIAIFGLVILLHGQLTTPRKIKLIALFGGTVLLATGVWQFHVYRTYHYTYLDWYVKGGLTGPSHNFSIHNVVKSIFALLIAAWFLVPFSYPKFKQLADDQHRFLLMAFFPPFLCLAWGSVSSRLFYVCVPMLAVLAWLGLQQLVKPKLAKYAILAGILAINVAWLIIAVRSGRT
jgi:hypothetical protein